MKIVLKSILLIVGCLLNLACNDSDKTLFDLQLAASSATENKAIENILTKCKIYYLDYEIADSIIQLIEDSIDVLADKSIVSNKVPIKISLNRNPYQIENELQTLIKEIMLCRITDQKYQYNNSINTLRSICTYLDSVLIIDYWSDFCSRVEVVNNEQSKNWLRAYISQQLAKTYHNDDINWELTEAYFAIGFQSLQHIPDERLELDLWQRLLFVLFNYRGLNDLAVILGEHYTDEAKKINYHLRATGLAYHSAEAIFETGNNKNAVESFKRVVAKAQKYQYVPYISWYERNGNFKLAQAYWRSGEFSEAKAICDRIKAADLNYIEKLQLYATYGLIFRYLGQYEQAQKAFSLALNYADSSSSLLNKVNELSHMGMLNYSLTEYEIALEYLDQATGLIESHAYQDHPWFFDIYLNKAKILHKLDRYEEIEKIVSKLNLEADKMAYWPVMNADHFNMLGEFALDLDKSVTALTHFQKAESICEQNALERLALKTKIQICKIHLKTNNHNQCRENIDEALLLVKQLGSKEGLIECLALKANLEQKENNISEATGIYNSLLNQIEDLTSQFETKGRLMAYRQMIYDHLKKSVEHEIAINRYDSAFVKLDYAKARVLKTPKKNRDREIFDSRAEDYFLRLEDLKDELDRGRILLDFFLTDDSLFLFVLHDHQLTLLRKEIDLILLKQNIQKYTNLLKNTINIFYNYNRDQIKSHIEQTKDSSAELYDVLFNWPSLEILLEDKELIYIVPDDVLFELPFSTLLYKEADRSKFLIERSAIAYLPSSAFLVTNSPRKSISDSKLLISGNTNLPGVERVIALIKNSFINSEILTQKTQISTQNFVEIVSKKYDGFIFIGHGQSNLKYPDLSSIELTALNKNTGEPKTFPLYLKDLYHTDECSLEMVILVGCETASGKVYKSTGLFGIHQGFMFLGSHNILGTLWEIDLAQSLNQLEDFINALSNDIEPALALRNFQVRTIQKLYNDNYYIFPHPYFWGGYTLYNM